jgi:putative ABC transport system ATP-binding protein
MVSATVVTLSNVRWSAGERTILECVDLAVDAGELVAFVGASGTGKTALLHLLAGIERPDEGTIAWIRPGRPGWADVTLVPQTIALVDELTVGENIDFAHRVAGARRESVNEELLSSLGLERLRHRLVDEISVGERQRSMVARALAGTAGLLLADEPTAHQDQHHARAVVSAIRDFARDGRAAVIATRDLTNLFGLPDRVLILSAGRVR